jgi:hypothetical protein
MPDVEVAVLESLLNRYSARGIKCKHAVKEVEGIEVGVGEEALERDFGHEREIANVVLGTRGANTGESFFTRGTKIVQNLVQLVDVIATFEKWSPTEEFRKDTTHGPYINWTAEGLSIRLLTRRICTGYILAFV